MSGPLPNYDNKGGYGADGIPHFLDRRILVHSFSSLNSYRNCPEQMNQTYIAKTIPYEETPERKKGNDLHKAMEYRVPGGKPLPDGMQQYEPLARAFDGRPGVISEPALGVTKFREACGFWDDKTSNPGKRVWLRGKADVVVLGPEAAYLVDWKSGKDNPKYEDPFELAVQALLLQAKYPNIKKIVGQYAWLQTMRMSTLYDLSDTDSTWEEVNRIVGSVESDRARGDFEKKRSGLCGYCGHSNCENWRPRT